MPTPALRTLVLVLALGLFPSVSQAGDSPIFVVGDWGVGTIDNRFMLYLGNDHHLDTPIPSTPRWLAWYAFVGGTLLNAWAVYRRRRAPQRSAAARRGFELLKDDGGQVR
jgi:hypothetical protein